MTALITGASSGIGEALAKNFASRGINLVLVARREDKLKSLKNQIRILNPDVRVKIICRDLSNVDECKALHDECRPAKIDILVNNAGFGLFGKFDETELDRELEMIDVNCKGLHTLTKLFLRDFTVRNHGYILNVASAAGYMPGPLMTAYYATKGYVLQLSRAIYGELKRRRSNVSISVLCPGPVKTEFNSVAGAEFALGGASAAYVADCAVNGLFSRQLEIVPTAQIKALRILAKLTPVKMMMFFVYYMQQARRGGSEEKGDLFGFFCDFLSAAKDVVCPLRQSH